MDLLRELKQLNTPQIFKSHVWERETHPEVLCWVLAL